MTPIRKALPLILAVVACESASALDLRGIAPGDPWDTTKLKRAFPELEFCGEDKCSGEARLGTNKVWIDITPGGDPPMVKVVRWELYQREGFERLMQDLSKKFGKPSFQSVTPMENAFGARFVDERYFWFTSKHEVICYLHWETQYWGICELRPRSKDKPEAPGPI